MNSLMRLRKAIITAGNMMTLTIHFANTFFIDILLCRQSLLCITDGSGKKLQEQEDANLARCLLDFAFLAEYCNIQGGIYALQCLFRD